MTTPLTLTAYAALRGCSVKSVSRAIATGRLVASVGRTDRNQPVILDPELADREWAANTRQRADGQAPVVAFARQGTPSPKQSDGANARERTVDAGASPAPDTTYHSASPPGAIPDLNTSRQIREAALARRDTAHADLAELELARERGRLVDAKEADAGYEEHIARAKTRLLGVPAQLGQRLPDLALRVVPVAKELIREALAELALDGRA